MKKIQITKAEAKAIRDVFITKSISVFDGIDENDKKAIREAEKKEQIYASIVDKMVV